MLKLETNNYSTYKLYVDVFSQNTLKASYLRLLLVFWFGRKLSLVYTGPKAVDQFYCKQLFGITYIVGIN